MITTIIFDMGNVLIPFWPNHYLEQFVAEPNDRKRLKKEVFRSIEWLLTDTGDLTPKQAAEKVKARVPVRLHKEVEQLFLDWISVTIPFGDIENLVKEIKEVGYKIYLLSNTSVAYHTFKKHIPAIKHMDGEFISADYRMIKPYPQIYQKFLETFSLSPQECFFIDDSSLNIYGAAQVGIRGMVYHGNYIELREELIRQGIPIQRL